MIAILDYGMGNVKAFANILQRLGVLFEVIDRPGPLANASKIILPGVGAIDEAVSRLDALQFTPALHERVLGEGIPILGVCVGMQLFARESEEGRLPGFGWLDAQVKRFDQSQLDERAVVPHMGWNEAVPAQQGGLFEGITQNARFYFLHSYYMCCHVHDDIAAVARYGDEFTCAVRRNNIYGVQFHPEKSHAAGVQVLKNFVEI